jgi:hypothetical protein
MPLTTHRCTGANVSPQADAVSLKKLKTTGLTTALVAKAAALMKTTAMMKTAAKATALMKTTTKTATLMKTTTKTAAKAAAKATAKSDAKTAEANAQPRRIRRVQAWKLPRRVLALLIPRRHLTGLKLGIAQLLNIILEIIHCINLH